MRNSLIVTSVVALAVPLAAAGTATAAPRDRVEICHFAGHVQPADPDQPDFILDLSLSYEARVAECTDRDGRVIEVNANAISYINDDIRRGHEVDVP
jgi:hypothetical protein